MRSKILTLSALVAVVLLSACSGAKKATETKAATPAQPAVTAPAPPTVTTGGATPNGRPGGPGGAPGGAGSTKSTPKPYSEVITAKAKTDDGLFKVHFVDDKYFVEIPDSLLGRDLLVMNRIAKAAADNRAGGGFAGFAGDYISQSVIRFEKGPNNRVFMKNISFAERASDTSNMAWSVQNSTIQPIIQTFEIKSLAKDSNGVVLEVTDFVNTDNETFFFNSSAKRTYNLGGIQTDKSYISSVKSYPENIEVRVVRTYSRSGGATNPGAPSGFGAPPPTGNATYELNASILLLPKTPSKPRYFDERVGYFVNSYTDFDANPQGVERILMAKRWKLEPKAEDYAKYNRGELVEPIKPIVFYIDPSTPKKWIPFLMQGVNDWQSAFEKAGFKNAIYAKLPDSKVDKEFSMEDIRYTTISYKPSEVANASGPSYTDPRSGEIINTSINWYHNVMELLRDWYIIQASPNDPGARKMEFEDELMGQLIRFVSSHEVGHTLGLRHNFGSSSSVPVEKLRDKAWVEANGHTPSIMDYARFNYVAQPEDKIARPGIFPRIGDYDKWAIEWGYKWFPQYKTAKEEVPALNQMTINALKNPRNIFITEVDPTDPRAQSEDLGDNSMKASEYGVKNLQRIVPNLKEWTKEPQKGYENMKQIYEQVVNQYRRYNGHVTKNVGGFTTTPKTVEQSGPIYEVTPEAQQKEAMAYLNKHVFTTPEWLLPKEVVELGGVNTLDVVSTSQNSVINRLVSNSQITRMQMLETMTNGNTYTAWEMLTDLRKNIFSELPSRKPIDSYRRNLQKMTVDRLATIAKPDQGGSTITLAPGIQVSAGGSTAPSDAVSLAKGSLRSIQADIRAALPAYTDNASKLHLQDLNDRITAALKVD